MPDDPQGPPNKRTKLWLALAAVVVLVALIVVPPFISLNHYKTRVTRSMAAALGRPVRLSEVDLRLLPWPGFLFGDLTVEEDPAFGAEPVLHATTVKAAIRFSSLWQGKLQISRISVDEASFNLVHMADGRWNVDSLFRNTARVGAATGGPQQPPYMEATNSRINIKNGVEKLPFSLVGADASMWRESNGDWRVRLRGQPARTDVTLDLADTGIVRLEATLHPAAQLNQMPLHVDLDWREAQLGQLSRLVLGSDAGWRGDLTGELHMDGTADSAKVQSRLRATGVHRAEFAPAAPLDFDATCAFTVHYNGRSLENLACNSPIGEGRLRVMGDLPGGGKEPKLTVELDRIPAQAALDLLRTMRNRIDTTLQAAGSVSGHMTYDPDAAESAAPVRKASGKPPRTVQTHGTRGPLTGSFTATGLRISGEALSRPIQVPTTILAPMQTGQTTALTTSMPIAAGGPTPLMVTARLGLSSFSLAINGTAAIPRLREFAQISGSPAEQALAQLAGPPAALDLTAEGPWVPPADVRLTLGGGGQAAGPSIQTNGTLTLHAANWKAGFLANAVLISSATLHVGNGELRWDPVEFSFGPVKGAATLAIPSECDDPDGCPPRFTLKLEDMDAAAIQAALLGAREKGTLLSTLLSRLTASPAWPRLQGTAEADSMTLGPFLFKNVRADLQVKSASAEATRFNADLLGGNVHGTASLTAGDKPEYAIEAVFSGLDPADAGQLAAMEWAGGQISGNGKIEMTGFTDADLMQSAKGTIHFEWQHGAVVGEDVPAALTRFDRLTGDAILADGGMTLKETEAQRGSRKAPVEAAVTFGNPAQVRFAPGAKAVPASASRR